MKRNYFATALFYLLWELIKIYPIAKSNKVSEFESESKRKMSAKSNKSSLLKFSKKDLTSL